MLLTKKKIMQWHNCNSFSCSQVGIGAGVALLKRAQTAIKRKSPLSFAWHSLYGVCRGSGEYVCIDRLFMKTKRVLL